MGNPKFRVISVSPQKKRKNRYTVQLSNGDVFGISGDVLLSNPIHTGEVLNSKTIERLIGMEDLRKVRESALTLLSYRMRSKKEMGSRLRKKGFIPFQIASIMEELEYNGLIDDEKFGLSFARDKVKINLLGPIALKYRLKQHFSSFDKIEQICNTIYQEFPIESLIKNIVEKHSTAILKNNPKKKKRLVNQLKRKGYFWSDIEPVLDQFDI